MTYTIYLIILGIFALRSLQNLESNLIDLKESRSKEHKVLLRKKIKRDKKEISLSVVWPWLLCKALYSAILSMKKS
jgi:hypothetical protein